MDSSRSSLLTAFERVAGLIALVVFGIPMLILAVILFGLGGRPVIVTDTVSLRDGFTARSYRFRTTGSGTLSRGFTRWIRRSRLEELPALWNVVRGEMTLADWVYSWSRGAR